MSKIELLNPAQLVLSHVISKFDKSWDTHKPYDETWDKTLRLILTHGSIYDVRGLDWGTPVLTKILYNDTYYYVRTHSGALYQVNMAEVRSKLRVNPSLKTKLMLLRATQRHLNAKTQIRIQTDAEERELFLKTLHDEINQNK